MRGGGKELAPNNQGCLEIQPDMRRSPTDVEMSHLKGTHFGRFLPTSNPRSAAVKPKFHLGTKVPSQSAIRFPRGAEHFYRSGKGASNIEISWFLERREDTLFMPASHVQCLIRISRSCLTRQYLPIMKIWTCREEPPNTVTFCEDIGH